MLKQKRDWTGFFLVFLIFFLSLTVFSGSGISLAIKGVAPILAMSILVPFAGYYSVSLSAVTGVLCGAVLDSTSADSYCFNTIALLLAGVTAHLLSHSVFNRNLKAVITLCLLETVVYYIFYWLFFIAFSLSFSDNLRYLLQIALPSGVYTAVFSAPFYFFFRFLQKRKLKN